MNDYDRKFAQEVGKALAEKEKRERREKRYRSRLAQMSGSLTTRAADGAKLCAHGAKFDKCDVDGCVNSPYPPRR
jgi:hypothetical protein